MQKKTSIPLFAITMGDPAGIGPEIALKALSSSKLPKAVGIFIIGDLGVLAETAKRLKRRDKFHAMASPEDFQKGLVNVLDMKQITVGNFALGRPQANCGKASYEYVIRGIELCLDKKICGMITNPISKEALHMAGINYPGHTEILADKTGTREFSMMFAVENVYVVHVTTHVSLRDAIGLITADRVLMNIRLLYKTLLGLGVRAPRIAVGGLNPHAGENGLFGNEETEHITPAIDLAKKEGINASGPYPPDTVFTRSFKGEFDGVVAMLHDHGFVALKSRDFESGVNITVGLPIIRTSVGHGTAFDKAGKGVASEKSLLAAIEAAILLWKNKINN
ncbi:MAG TPA: 4-hydroxythreonine-4-phosphate dehydrogenase PdxA [Chitinivibrionales bacterium]|nr:4-hydroxythreonine-4-phosphate dehydrogenase PdxA [Chitinivibrionales bacterium]